LVCIAGPQLGSEYPLTGEEVVVGRSPDNAISIPDNSVSRKHLLLRQTPAGWMASDMGSGNGTLINGETIDEETLLENGDQIALGDTEFQFVFEGELEQRLAKFSGSGAALSHRRPELRRPERQGLRARQRGQEKVSKKDKRRYGLLLLLGAMMALVGIGIYVQKKKERERPLIEAAERERERERILNERLQNARNLIREGNWFGAQHALQELQGQAPDFKTKEIENLLKAAEQEVPNQAAMDAAKDALSLLELREAHVRLEQVKDTVQNERLRLLRQEFQEAVRKKVARANALASQTSNREKMVELKTMTDDLLAVAPRPQDAGHRDATSLQSIAQEAIRRLDMPVTRAATPQTPWVAVTEKYKAGEVEEATQLAEACAPKHAPCKTMHAQLIDFADKNRRIEKLTPREFFAFYELDRKLSEGAGSANTKRIMLFAVPAIENNARNANLAGRLGEASTLASGLLKMDSKNTVARNIMEEVREKAKNTYMRAYSLRSTQPDQAERLFNEVVQMLPSNEDYAQRAQTQLRALRRGRLADEE